MPYIVRSSLDISGKIVPWNEVESQKLVKEKEEFIKAKNKDKEVVKETTQETTQKTTQERDSEKEELKSSKVDRKKK